MQYNLFECKKCKKQIFHNLDELIDSHFDENKRRCCDDDIDCISMANKFIMQEMDIHMLQASLIFPSLQRHHEFCETINAFEKKSYKFYDMGIPDGAYIFSLLISQKVCGKINFGDKEYNVLAADIHYPSIMNDGLIKPERIVYGLVEGLSKEILDAHDINKNKYKFQPTTFHMQVTYVKREMLSLSEQYICEAIISWGKKDIKSMIINLSISSEIALIPVISKWYSKELVDETTHAIRLRKYLKSIPKEADRRPLEQCLFKSLNKLLEQRNKIAHEGKFKDNKDPTIEEIKDLLLACLFFNAYCEILTQ